MNSVQSPSSIPEARTEDGKASVRVIAGEALGAAAVIETRTPILYHHWRLEPGADVEVPVPEDHNAGVYVFAGALRVGGQPVRAGQIAALGEGDAVRLEADEAAQALLLGGRPLNEPIAWMGPFVMNTREEIEAALADVQAGRMGTIPPEIVRA